MLPLASLATRVFPSGLNATAFTAVECGALIYPALRRLEDAGLLGSSWMAADGRRRRVYSLTDKGVAALAAERTEWRRFARGMQAVTGWSA